MRKPNFRRIGQGIKSTGRKIGQGFSAAGKKIAAIASAGRTRARNYFEARGAANTHLVMTKEEAKKMGGMQPTYRRQDKRRIMRMVRKEGLSAVVQEMEQRVMDYHTRQYQPKEVRLRKKEGSVVVLTGLDAERARIPKLEQISRLIGARHKVLTQCQRIIESTDLRRIVDNTRPKTLRQLSDSIGRVLVRRKPFVGEIREDTINESTKYGERVSISSAGLVTIEHFRDKQLLNAVEHRIKPEEIQAFKEYHNATKRWHESLNEYSKQEWAEE